MFPSNPVDGQPYKGEWVYNESEGVWLKKRTKVQVFCSGEVVRRGVYVDDPFFLVRMVCFGKYFGHLFFKNESQYSKCWFRLKRWTDEFSEASEFFKKGYDTLDELASWVQSHLEIEGSQSFHNAELELIDIIDYDLTPPDILPINVSFSMMVGKSSSLSNITSYCGDHDSEEVYEGLRDITIELFRNFWGYDVSSFSEEELKKCMWIPVNKTNMYGNLRQPLLLDAVSSGSHAGDRNVYDPVANKILNLTSVSYVNGADIDPPNLTFLVVISLDQPPLHAVEPRYSESDFSAFAGNYEFSGSTIQPCSCCIAYPLKIVNRYASIMLKPFQPDGLRVDCSFEDSNYALESVFFHNRFTRSLYRTTINEYFGMTAGAPGTYRSQPVPFPKFLYHGFYNTDRGALRRMEASVLQYVKFRKKDLSTYYVSRYSKNYFKATFRIPQRRACWKFI